MKNRKNFYKTVTISSIAGLVIAWILIKINSPFIALFSGLIGLLSILAHKQSFQYKSQSYNDFSNKIISHILQNNQYINTIWLSVIIITTITLLSIFIKFAPSLALIISLSMPIILTILLKLKKNPNQYVKNHSTTTDGFFLYLWLITNILLWFPSDPDLINFIICCSIFVTLGIAEEKLYLPPQFSILVQFLVASYVSIDGKLNIEYLGDILGLGQINLGLLSYIVTVATVIGTINAFKMIDGIDRLLLVSSLATLIGMAALFNLSVHPMLSLLTNRLTFYLILIALIPILANKLNIAAIMQRKVSMRGSAGSMLIGFSVIWLLIQGSQDTVVSAFRPVTALWLIAFPLMDMARVITYRIWLRQSPFHNDRLNLHYIIEDIYGKKHIFILIGSLSSLFVMTGYVMETTMVQERISFLLFIGLSISYFVLFKRLS